MCGVFRYSRNGSNHFFHKRDCSRRVHPSATLLWPRFSPN